MVYKIGVVNGERILLQGNGDPAWYQNPNVALYWLRRAGGEGEAVRHPEGTYTIRITKNPKQYREETCHTS